MARDDVDAGLGLAVVVVGGDHAGRDVGLAHPDLARAVALARDGLEAPHARRLRGVLAQLVVAGVVEVVVPAVDARVLIAS